MAVYFEGCLWHIQLKGEEEVKKVHCAICVHALRSKNGHIDLFPFCYYFLLKFPFAHPIEVRLVLTFKMNSKFLMLYI